MTKVQTFPVKGYIDVLLPSKTLIFSRGSEGNIGKKRVKLVLKLLLNSKSFTRSGLNTTRTQEKLDNREKIIFSFPLKKNSGTKSTLTSIKL